MGLLALLKGGDLRSIGRADEVLRLVLADPAVLEQLITGMAADDPVLRMRSADVAEKLSRQHPDWLEPWRQPLVSLALKATQQELRWHLAQILPRLQLSPGQRGRLADALFGYMADESRIVRVEAMTALVHLARQDNMLVSRVKDMVEERLHAGAPSERARARRLLTQL